MTATMTSGAVVEVKVGSVVEPDSWRACGQLVASDWDQAEFRLTSPTYAGVAVPVNVTITGRTVQRRSGCLVVRVQVEFVNEDEPNVTRGGWLVL